MKILLTTILLATASYAFSQTEQEIYLKWDNNQLKIERGDTSSIVLPFTLRFKEANFKQRVLKWKNGNIVIPGTTKIFGSDIKLTAEDGGYYKVILEVNEEKVVSNILGEILLPKNSVTLEISGKPITLHYKMIKKDVANKLVNEKEEQYTAGYIYYDAMALVSNKIPDSTKLKIYTAYGYIGTDDNPYLQPFYKKISSTHILPTDAASFLTNLGNTDVTNFAAGLARFLAERTKDELNEAFFSKMKEQLNAYPELKTAFPKTASYMDKIETYAYASILNALKDAFEMDMQNLPANVYEIKNLNPSKCSFISKDKLKTSCEERMTKLKTFFESQDGRWVGLGMYTAKEAIASTNPSNLLKSVVESGELKVLKDSSKAKLIYDDYNVIASIELSNLISQSLVSTDEKQVYINTSQLSSLFKTKDAFKVYLGLLLAHEQKSESKIDFFNKNDSLITFETMLIEKYNKYQEFESLVKNVHSAFNSANNAVKKMIAASEKSVETDPQALYDYYRTFTSSFKPIANSPLLKTITGKDIGAKYEKVEQFLNPAVDIAYHISTKKYSAAIYDASILLSVLDTFKTKEDRKFLCMKLSPKEKMLFKPVTKSFVKYGTLISTVANAQTSEEVKNAIEASVLPVGSSSIKRNSAWSISLNGYVGGFYGQAHSTIQDTLRNTSTNQLDTISKPISYRTFGLYAPIGLSFNRGFKSGWGITLHAQILDLGALVNFYLTEGDKASLPTDFKVKLSDILSPGIQLGINIPKTPLTIMGGMQYVPALNNSSQISTSQLSPIAWRAQIGIVVDIPLYNLKVWDFKK